MKNKLINKIKSYDNLDLQTKKAETDGDIMDIAAKDVVTAPQSSSIIEIANLMSKNDFRRIPITDPGSGKLLGIVTTMDILDFFGGGKKYNIITDKHKGNFLSAINAPIKEIMTVGVKTMTNTDTIVDTTTLMLEEGIGGLPIINNDEKLKYYKKKSKERIDFFNYKNRISDIERLFNDDYQTENQCYNTCL